MRTLRVIFIVLALGAVPLRAADQPDVLNQAVDRIVAQEHQEVGMLKQYSPLVETYIQELRPDKDMGTVPAGDRYFLGRAVLSKGVQLEPLTSGGGRGHRVAEGLGSVFTLQMDFLPRGFLQMIYLDDTDFDRAHY